MDSNKISAQIARRQRKVETEVFEAQYSPENLKKLINGGIDSFDFDPVLTKINLSTNKSSLKPARVNVSQQSIRNDKNCQIGPGDLKNIKAYVESKRQKMNEDYNQKTSQKTNNSSRRSSSVLSRRQSEMMGGLEDLYDKINSHKELMSVAKSKDPKVKSRYMMTQIDSIFKEANKQIDRDVGKIDKDINEWASKNELPNNPQATFIKRKLINDQIMKRKEKTTAISKAELYKQINRDRIESEKLREKFNIKLETGLTQRIGTQVSNFCVKKGAFFEFKKCASIQRTLNLFNGVGDKKFIEEKQQQNGLFQNQSQIEVAAVTIESIEEKKQMKNVKFEKPPIDHFADMMIIDDLKREESPISKVQNIKKWTFNNSNSSLGGCLPEIMSLQKSQYLSRLPQLNEERQSKPRSSLHIPKIKETSFQRKKNRKSSETLKAILAQSQDILARRSSLTEKKPKRNNFVVKIKPKSRNIEQEVLNTKSSHESISSVISRQKAAFMTASQNAHNHKKVLPVKVQKSVEKVSIEDLIVLANAAREKNSVEKRNLDFDCEMLRESIKQNEFFRVIDQISGVGNLKPEFVRQYYYDAMFSELSMSETEVTSRIDYERSKLNTQLWHMIEKDRKMKAAQEYRKKKQSNI